MTPPRIPPNLTFPVGAIEGEVDGEGGSDPSCPRYRAEEGGLGTVWGEHGSHPRHPHTQN